MAYKNKEDQVACAKRYYEANRERMKAKAKARNIKQRERNRAYIKDIKENSSCIDCGESDNRVLDFDHVIGEKIGDVSNMVNQCYCIESLQREVDKCEVRCSNCHRKVTHERRKQNAKDNS
tara:strand:- start:3115 stop:3477 length:363 start_codon:yes stop_codon:yes gene_type:complete